MIAALQAGWPQREILRAAHEYHRKIKEGELAVIGVNMFEDSEEELPLEILRIDPSHEEHQVRMLREVKAKRDGSAVRRSLDGLKRAVERGENIMPACLEVVKAYATIEETMSAIQDVVGCGEESKHAFVC